MAIINSVVMGSSRKAVGEVVTVTRNGHTIAKKRAKPKRIESSVNVQNHSEKVRNLNYIYKMLCLMGLNGFSAPERGKSWFNHVWVQYMPYVLTQHTGTGAAILGRGSQQFTTNPKVRVLGYSGITGANYRLLFDYTKLNVQVGDLARTQYWRQSTGALVDVTNPITQAHIDAREYSIGLGAAVANFIVGVQIYSQRTKKWSHVYGIWGNNITNLYNQLQA